MMSHKSMITIYRDRLFDLRWPLLHRDACRGIIFHEGKLAMIHSDRNGDYKFPGGGVESDESLMEALRREVLEESGIEIKAKPEAYVMVEELGSSVYETNTIFRMHSHYYRCVIEQLGKGQRLDDYEEEAHYRLCFVTVADALANNLSLLSAHQEMPWLPREIAVLKMLQQDG